MVTRLSKRIRPSLLFAATILALVATGCAPAVRTAVRPGFAASPELETVYVVPFTGILVPTGVSTAVFDEFVDLLNEGKSATPVQQFVIIKDDLKSVDPTWLAKQVYITGELWGYVENSGCCSTEMRVKTRASLFEPGMKTPSAEITVPLETFFEHDRATLTTIQQRLARQAARELSTRILEALHR